MIIICQAIDVYNNDDAKRISELVLHKMEEPEPIFNIPLPKPNNNNWKLPELSYGQNPEVPCFSSAVSLEYNKELGRHLISNRNINTGKVKTNSVCFSCQFSLLSFYLIFFPKWHYLKLLKWN
jgi:hypothetical protein